MITDFTPREQMLAAALRWYDQGFSVVRVRTDGSKRPVGEWKQYTQQRASRQEVIEWFTSGDWGLGLVMGAVSDGAELLELEGRAMTTGNLEQLEAQMRYAGVEKEWADLQANGYAEWTPSGGLHLIYRVPGGHVPGNMKIANGTDKSTLAETRGEGGFVVVAPTGGNCHPSGEGWKSIGGDINRWMWLGVETRGKIFTAIKNALHTMPAKPEYLPKPTRITVPGTSDLRPGDDFNIRAEWDDILPQHGWTYHSRHGNETFWTRPGKSPRDGHSASTGYSADGDRLFIWSSGTDLDMETPLSKFHVYAHYEHGGDYEAAGRALRALKFGSPLPDRDDDFSALLGTRMPQVEDDLKAPQPTDDDLDWPAPPWELGQPVQAEGAKEGDRLRGTLASEFKIKAVRWLWQGRVPLGEITLVPGREGVGKSIFLANMAAQITRGTLPGEFFGTPKAVAYIASEDSWQHTLVPRFIAAGADLTMIHRIDIDPVSGQDGVVTLPTDCEELARYMKAKGIGVLMLDPIVSLIHATLSSYKAPELRKALEPLRTCAESANVAVLALAHFNKSGGGDVSSQVAGSRAWLEVSRAAISIARMENEDRDEDDPADFLNHPQYTCVVSQEKNNLGRTDLPNLTYVIEERFLDTDDEDGKQASVGVLRWTGETNVSVTDLLNPSDRRRELGDSAKDVLSFVKSEYKATGMAVSLEEIYRAVPDLTAVNVRKILSRQVKAGRLESFGRGAYKIPDRIKAIEVKEIESGPRADPQGPRPDASNAGWPATGIERAAGERSVDFGGSGFGDPDPGADGDLPGPGNRYRSPEDR